jgi:hypothetical protein
MKRRTAIPAIAIALILITLGCASRQPPSVQTRQAGKALEPLPAKIEGVEVLGHTLRTKPGFKWVKQGDATFIARRMVGTGGGIVIRVGCGCDTGPYACEAVQIDDSTIRCQNVRDCLSCKWFRPPIEEVR